MTDSDFSDELATNQMNPFPGLRPFREEEEFLFFGRENQVDAMVDKLAVTHFLAVIGGSGSGKSSLVNCGLRPALHTGMMASAGTRWRMAQFRPGNNPIGEMALALAEDGILFSGFEPDGMSLAEIVDTSLRMSKNGLIDIYEQANLEKDVNLLIVVDQFEELFRYRQLESGADENAYGMSAEATAFVNLLLAVKERKDDYPIHVVLTMRTDFLGDCTKFTGLAEAINGGQYLVPRMTRDERRDAISGPVGVGGAEISPVLLTRLVNDVGDNPDQLSILQHALNRTWACWQSEGRPDEPLDLPHYEAIGTMASALDKHAEKAFEELTTPRQRQICEKMFKVLTDKATDPRGVRRPTILGALCAMAEANEAEIVDVIDVFRKPSRSFLMPPAEKPIELDTPVDISHESLMRVWQKLNTWADAEAKSAALFRRLSDAARRYEGGNASLWRDPDLQQALDWREKEKPTAAWAELYQGGFEQAMAFLDKSKKVNDAETAETELVDILRIARNVVLGLVAASLLIGPLGLSGSRIKKEDFYITDDFANGLSSEECKVVVLDQTSLKTIRAGRDEQAKSVGKIRLDQNINLEKVEPSPKSLVSRDYEKTGKNGASETTSKCVLDSLFTKQLRTPFEENYIRPLLYEYSVVTSEEEIDRLFPISTNGTGSQVSSSVNSAGASENPVGPTGQPLDPKQAGAKPEKLTNSLEKLRNSLDRTDLPTDGKNRASAVDSGKIATGVIAENPELTSQPSSETQVPAPSDDPNSALNLDQVSTTSTDEGTKPQVLVLPQDVNITSRADDQVWLVGLFLKWNKTKNLFIRNAEYAARFLELSIVFAHIVLYFCLILGIGYFYRKLEYRGLEEAGEGESDTTPWHLRVFALLRRVSEYSEPLRTRRGKLITYIVFLSLYVATLYLFFDLKPGWAYAVLSWVYVSFVLLAILLFPPDVLLIKSWALRIRTVQGISLQLAGLFLLILGFWLFYVGYYFSFDPSLRIIGNPWIFWNPLTFLIMGSSLLVIGKIKCAVTTEEILVSQPNTAPVVYLRSFDNAKQNWKEAWAAYPSRFFRPKEEQMLRSIFETLGPFVQFGLTGQELLDAKFSGKGQDNTDSQEAGIISDASLVLIQIDERPSESYLAQIRDVLQTLNPEQVLIYFSLRMNEKRLGATYKEFADAVQSVIPEQLPESIDTTRFLAFDSNWQPYVFGEVTPPKIRLSKLLPILGRRIDVIRARRFTSIVLKDFFASRDLVNPDKKLYGDIAIGFAAFPVFLFFPAGYMVFINFWRTGRRLVAAVGLFAPAVLFALLWVAVSVMIGLFQTQSDYSPIYVSLFVSGVFFMFFIYPFCIHWAWRRLSGRTIRRHIALGGPLQPWWKNFAVPFVSIILIFGLGLLASALQTEFDPTLGQDEIPYRSFEKGKALAEQGNVKEAAKEFESIKIYKNAEAASYVWSGISFAKKGDWQNATEQFRKARELDPNIELDPTIKSTGEATAPNRDAKVEKSDPEKIARLLAANYLIDEARELAKKSDIVKAQEYLCRAQKIDRTADLNPDTTGTIENDFEAAHEPDADCIYDQDRTDVTSVPVAVVHVWQGTQLAKQGLWKEAIESFSDARKNYANIDLDPETEKIDQDPEIAAKTLASNFEVEEGSKLARIGRLAAAVEAYNLALNLNPKIDLNPTTSKTEKNPEAVALVWYGAESAGQGRLSEAIEVFKKARTYDRQILLDPTQAASEYSLSPEKQFGPFEMGISLAFRAKI